MARDPGCPGTGPPRAPRSRGNSWFPQLGPEPTGRGPGAPFSGTSSRTPSLWRCGSGCGFYCLHEIADARALGCATENRSALLLEITAAGRYIRYERGLRYSRQRVRVIRDAWCGCGRPGVVLADAGTGLVGWRHLAPFCARCAAGRPALSLPEFAARLDGTVLIDQPTAGAGLAPLGPDLGLTGFTGPGGPPGGLSEGGFPRSPISLLTAGIA